MVVKTIRGIEVDKKDCIKIQEEYYQKNVDVVRIDGRWYRIGNPKIYFNSIENCYKKITPNTTNGICGYKDNSYVIGNFELDFEHPYSIRTKRNVYKCGSKEIFDSIPKIWNKSSGFFMDLDYAVSYGYNKDYDNIYSRLYIYDFERMYNSEKLLPIFKKVDNSKYTKRLLNNKYNKSYGLINKYSFGLEIETAGGIIPQHECVQLGLIPLRDGSIKGHEYTTIPMIGEEGINLLINQFEVVKRECMIDKDCSLHVHFGNFPLNEDKILRLYNLLVNIQDEIRCLFHKWIYNTEMYKSSGKDYCKKLPGSASSIDSLYLYLSENNSSWDGSFTRPHPCDPRRDRKWDNHKRYFFCNLINMLFGSEIKTVEFRIHTPTLNYTKVINWLFICMAILNYAESSESIDNVNLDDIIKYSYDKNTAKVLIEYMNLRKNTATFNNVTYGDEYGVIELIDDCKVMFDTPYDCEP